MESCPELRHYNPIWRQLKALSRELASTKGISISAPRPLHRRIIKAVKKEKWLDLGYKLEIEPRKATLHHVRDGSKITFLLTFSLTEEDF